MLRRITDRLHEKAGETIAETLIALLISALALTMLAAAISTATGIVTRSRTRVGEYYDANENADGVVYMSSSSGPNKKIVTITSDNPKVNMECSVQYFVNSEFNKTPVVAYKEVE